MYEGLMQYLEESPQLKGKKFNFDWFGAKPMQYTVSIPTNTPEISTDTLGNTRCQLVFYLMAVKDWGDDTPNNIENLEFLRKLSKWFEAQNKAKKFPVLEDGMVVTKVSSSTQPYLEGTTDMVGRYQIQCKVEYTQINQEKSEIPLRW